MAEIRGQTMFTLELNEQEMSSLFYRKGMQSDKYESRLVGSYIQGSRSEWLEGEFLQNEHKTAQTEAILNQELSWDF